MKQLEEIKAFKNELSNYRFYQKRIKSLDELIEYCYDMLGGVRAIQYDKEPSHCMPNKDMEYKIRDEISRHERNKKKTQERLDDVDFVLNQVSIEVKDVLMNVYADKEPIRKVASKMYLADGTLRYRINKELEKALLD